MNKIVLKKKKKSIHPHYNFKVEFSNKIFEIPYEENINAKTSKSEIYKYISRNKYFIQFLISIIVSAIFILIFLYQIYNLKENEKLSQELLNSYSLTTLYQDNEPVKIEKQSVLVENPFVIGIIKISKIGLNYPIISETNDDLLKISLCRFAGPMPNEYGNLCIAGHNYVDNKFFSNLSKLKNGDVIEIYDLHGKQINYEVFNKYEVKANDLSCTKQDESNKRIITLLTCNNVNGKRTVVKAKEIT